MSDCSIDGCLRKRKYAETGWCQTHYHRWWRTGRVNGLKQERGASGPDAVSWKGDDIGYRTAHERVQKARGKASEYRCEACPDRAAHWAYDGTDPDEKWESGTNNRGSFEVPFSTDVSRYQPLCLGCHVRADRWGRRIRH